MQKNKEKAIKIYDTVSVLLEENHVLGKRIWHCVI